MLFFKYCNTLMLERSLPVIEVYALLFPLMENMLGIYWYIFLWFSLILNSTVIRIYPVKSLKGTKPNFAHFDLLALVLTSTKILKI